MISQQFTTFGLTITLGFFIGILFDVYRVFSHSLHPSRIIIQIMDLLFWTGLSGLVFIVLFLGNRGEVRVYVFIGLLIGVFFYFRWLSRKMVLWINRILRWVCKIIGGPIYWMRRIVIVPVGWISMQFKKLLSPVINIANYIKNKLVLNKQVFRRIWLRFSRS